MADAEDRTQAASEKRLHGAREEGQAPLSREMVMAAGLAAAALVLSIAAPSLIRHLAQRLKDMLEDGQAAPGDALHHAEIALMAAAGPLMMAVLLMGCGAVLLQTGFLLHAGALLPDPSRLDPRRGLKRLFGRDNAVEAAKAVAKLVVLALAVWHAMDDLLPRASETLIWTSATMVERLGRTIIHLVLLVFAAQAGIALLDIGWMRWRFAQRLQMSRQELRQEQRESDGDPKIKGKLRQLRQARARRRMLAAVAKATVVVTNPTHFAVALAYQRGTQAAPRIVAKGADEVAARIRAEAERSGVPTVSNPPLARALYTLPLDAEVPAEHFRAVAEIIAYVWRLRGMAANR